MLAKKGFTLVELMVVVLIVAILAAVAIPIMRGRIDSAKWTEGRAMAGTIATALRAYGAENGPGPTGGPSPYGQDKPTLTEMGFLDTDFTGTYFNSGNYSWLTTYDGPTNVLTFLITINKPAEITSPDWWTLSNAGVWDNADMGGAGL